MKIGEPNDQYEQEADAVANSIMRGERNEGNFLSSAPAIRRKSATRNTQSNDGSIPRDEALSPLGPTRSTMEPDGELHGLRAPGQPLAVATRQFFEPRFGVELSDVRVHTDAAAAQSARQVGAQAYTVGKDIVFGAGQFAPESSEGMHLLTHELVHVVQQADAPRPWLQRSGVGRAAPQPEAPAGGCAVNLIATDAGTAAHTQIRMHLRRTGAGIRPLEASVPRANKGANGELVQTPCPDVRTAPGNVDLWYFDEPFFELAEVKPYTAHDQGLEEYAHYAGRLLELERRFFGGGPCGANSALTGHDEWFDSNCLGGMLTRERQIREEDAESDPAGLLFPGLVAVPLPASRVPYVEQDAGPFAGTGLHLFFWNEEDGTVLYQCREQEKEEESDEAPREELRGDQQLTLPLLVNGNPLLASWLETVELQQVPSGSAYAVVVSAPIYNALAFGAAGEVPYSRSALRLEAGVEFAAEVVIVLTLGRLAVRGAGSRGAAQPVVQGAREKIAQEATQRAGQKITQEAAQEAGKGIGQGATQAAERMAREAALKKSALESAVGSAAGGAQVEPAEPDASAVSPQQAIQESSDGRIATRVVPVFSASMTPKLYFVKTESEQASGVPLPFASANAPDALGQVAWQAISALVPQEGVDAVLGRRELGLLKNAIFYANPAVLGVYPGSLQELPEIGALSKIEGHEYVVIAHFVAP